MKSESLLKFIIPATIVLSLPGTSLADKPIPPEAAEKIEQAVARIENPRFRACISLVICMQSFTASSNSALPSNEVEVLRALFKQYLNDLDKIDITESSEKFQTAFNDHIKAVQALLKHLRSLPSNATEQLLDFFTRAAQERPLIDSEADSRDEWTNRVREFRRSVPKVAKALQSELKEELPSEKDLETLRTVRNMLKPYFVPDF